MLENGYFVNSKRQLYAIVNGAMYPLETKYEVKVEPGYYDEDGDPIEDPVGDAQFEESKHPRDKGKFTSGSGSGGAKRETAGKKIHERAKEKASKAAQQWLQTGTQAKNAIVAAAKDPAMRRAAAKGLTIAALGSLMAHATGNLGGSDPNFDDYIANVVHNFAESVGVPAAHALQGLKSAVQGLIAVRAGDAVDDDDISSILEEILGALNDIPGQVEDKDRLAHDTLALDRASVREIDQDGRLGVEITNISKANVCPYLGKEIPGMEELGLEPDQVYYLLRDPKSLQAAAPSFCNLPVLSQHIPVFAEDYSEQAKKYVIGATGSDCVFQAPYLRCSLKIWDGDAIKLIQSGEQKELSCGYHYRPVMKPGIHEGVKYDGVMLDIVGNHVALVKEGRAGSDVVVGDSKENLR